tara:strand:+ start:101 stop:502 length:402 start_codon:yes stop_codon:yes gene_type:complete
MKKVFMNSVNAVFMVALIAGYHYDINFLQGVIEGFIFIALACSIPSLFHIGMHGWKEAGLRYERIRRDLDLPLVENISTERMTADIGYDVVFTGALVFFGQYILAVCYAVTMFQNQMTLRGQIYATNLLSEEK